MGTADEPKTCGACGLMHPSTASCTGTGGPIGYPPNEPAQPDPFTDKDRARCEICGSDDPTDRFAQLDRGRAYDAGISGCPGDFHNEARAVGRCGAMLLSNCCELPHGHAGWHRQGQCEWREQFASTGVREDEAADLIEQLEGMAEKQERLWSPGPVTAALLREAAFTLQAYEKARVGLIAWLQSEFAASDPEKTSHPDRAFGRRMAYGSVLHYLGVEPAPPTLKGEDDNDPDIDWRYTCGGHDF